MDFRLTPEQLELQDHVRRYCARAFTLEGLAAISGDLGHPYLAQLGPELTDSLGQLVGRGRLIEHQPDDENGPEEAGFGGHR